MKQTELGDENAEDLADLQVQKTNIFLKIFYSFFQPDEIKAAVVYILHYGRPLFKGEGEPTPPEPEPERPKPVIHNNIFYPEGLPEDLVQKPVVADDDDYPEIDPDDIPEVFFYFFSFLT